MPLHVAAFSRAVAEQVDETSSSIPASLYDSLMADLDRLGPARATIQRCSVLGDPFTDDDLALLGGPDGAGAASREHVAAAVSQGCSPSTATGGTDSRMS